MQYVADTDREGNPVHITNIHCSNEVYEDVAAVRAGAHDRAHPARAVPRTGQTPPRRGSSASATWRYYSLDEFYPIRARPNSRAAISASTRSFLNHIDILPENIHIPDGTVPEAQDLANTAHRTTTRCDKIDLMIIGVGEDGQIGFNEPGSYAKSRTRLVQLTHNTRKIQSGGVLRRWKTRRRWPSRWVSTRSCAPRRSS